jgi:PAS domain S-box-containing protein
LTTNLSRILEEQQKYINLGTIIKDAAQDSIIIISPDLTILDMNPSAELTLGYACREVKGHPVENILIGAEILIPTLMAVQHEGYTYNLGNITLYRRDGRSFPAQIRAAPLTDSEHLESWILLIQDLSQEEQLRNRTQQLEQRALLGELMAVFAHEVRNPINNISTGLQLMAVNIPAEDPNQEVITRLQQDCDRLDHQMKSVLSFARPIEYKMEPVDLGLHLTRAKVQAHLQVETDLSPTLGDIRALEQVFTNLITNAIQAMSDHGGTLALKIQPIIPDGENEQIEVSVSDTGIGIPEENRDRIFEPFFTTGKNGTGLGLAITKRIVTAHKGTIKFDSVPGGTIFQVRLPAVKPQSVSEASE